MDQEPQGNYTPYDPFITMVILAVMAGIVSFVWGPRTLARCRYTRA